MSSFWYCRSAAFDVLYKWCCNAQKSKESLRALLHAKKLQKHTVEPGLVPEKLDTILLTQPRKKGIRAQYDARRRAKICSKTPPGMKEYPRIIEWRLVAPQEARKSHEVGLLFRKIFLKGRRESFSDCGNPSGEHPPKNWIPGTFFNLDTIFEIDSRSKWGRRGVVET